MFISFPKRYYSGVILLALSAVAWIGAMIVLLISSPKYLPDGGLLLFSDFEATQREGDKLCTKDFGCWTCSENGVLLVEKAGFGSSTGVRLTPAGAWGAFMLWDLKDPKRYDFLEFRGRMRVENIVIGKESWDIARSLLYFKDRKGKSRWDYPHTAKGLSGSSPWIEFSKVFLVPDFAISAHLMIQNSAKSGTIWIDDISLRSARLNHQFFRNRNILLGLGVIILFAFLFILKIWEDFGWMIPVIILVIALGVLCRHTYLEEIARVLNIRIEVLKKGGHFLFFLAMGSSFSFWLQRRSTIPGRISLSIFHVVSLFAALALFAAVTEFLQLLTLDRTPRLIDYLFDLSGIFLGVLLVFIFRRTHRIGPSKP